MASVILYVDDRPDLPAGFAESLAEAGYELLHTGDAEEAIRLVETRRPALVMMDLELRSCDGLDLMAGIRDPDLGSPPVLVLTCAARDSALHGEAIALGAADFVCKPARAAELLARVREIAPVRVAPPEPAPEPAAAEAPPELAGELSETPVPELLARLRRRGATGVLVASRGATRVGIELRNGSPIAVGSNRSSDGETALDDLSEEEAEQAISQRAEALLFETFRWSDGHYRFTSGRRLKAEGALAIARDPASLLLLGVLDASPIQLLRDRLAKRGSLYASSAEDEDGALAGAELTSHQERVLSDLGGSDTLSILLESKAFDERLLYGLWVAGRIELHAAPTLTLTELIGADPPAAEPELEPELELDTGSFDADTLELDVEPERAEPEPPAPARKETPPPDPHPFGTDALETDGFDPDLTPALDVDGEISPVRQRERRPRPAPAQDREALVQQLRELAQRVMSGDDFEALDVPVFATDDQVRSAHQAILREIPDAKLASADRDLRERAARIRDRIDGAYNHLKDPETRRAYALLRQEEEQDRGVKPSAERALEGERWFRKGKGLLKSRGYSQAAEAFGMAAHLDPEEGEYLAHLGYALYLSNPEEKVVQREAMEHVANGIKRSPDRELSYIYLGRILKAKGDVEAARKIFRRALKIKPDCHPALQELRVLEMRERKGKGVLSKLLKR
jgi:CheY-like chemotaxis protein/tetratricopeptide (TPR) repeat protein